MEVLQGWLAVWEVALPAAVFVQGEGGGDVEEVRLGAAVHQEAVGHVGQVDAHDGRKSIWKKQTV